MGEIDSEDASAQKNRNGGIGKRWDCNHGDNFWGNPCGVYICYEEVHGGEPVYQIEILILAEILVPLSKVRATKTTHFNISYLLPVFSQAGKFTLLTL